MAETVHLRASYRYANVRGAAIDAVIAAVGAMPESSLRCAITLASNTVAVDFDVPLFADCDLTLLALLERGCIESRVQKVQSSLQI